ncbi:MAG: type 1 glutamine amidotransferase domain-containing protein [Lysobacterales bacterium 14-68-21]|jgi:putative intracellular protease/amidase|nr:MAG: type 1 glutamine amidotransferase domain-containing protein [Xanthomonadales bacterium 15-68-25]OZB64378.1 MAG: type 1 glutamine amidotransferase domain-containing protein [Xanthomonadales bacterium 14-68-21]
MSTNSPNHAAPAGKRIALVIANPAVSSTTGAPVGFWWSELTHPYRVFVEAGYTVELFSPDGGACTADALSDPGDPSGYSSHDLVSQGFIHTPALMAKVANTCPVAGLAVEDFDALVVAGGQAPMFTFERATALHEAFAAFHAAGKVVAALCHGVAILAWVRGADGELLAKGRTVTGFANVEEDAADEAAWSYGVLPRGQHVMPWRIEDRLRALGANFVQVGAWRPFAVRDGQLITGQQNFSGEATARLVVEALGH